MERWSRKYDSCVNCKTRRYSHRGRGYCTRCYGLIRKLENVSRWDLADVSTLKDYPRDFAFFNEESFVKIKKGFEKQINDRLDFLKIREEKFEEKLVDPLDIEYQLRHLAQCARVRNKNIFFGIAGYIQTEFLPEQRKVLYHLLNEIEEGISWRGIDYYEIFLGEKE